MDVASCASRVALAALNTSTYQTAFLTEPGREGSFAWRSGDYSAEVASDTLQGIFVTSSSVAASTGAWVRIHQPGDVQVTWWGAVFDYVPGVSAPNHVGAALLAAIDYVAEAVAVPLDYQYGGVVRLPKGFGYLDDFVPGVFPVFQKDLLLADFK